MLELFGTQSCPFTADMREDLEWQQEDFTEYNVEQDHDALARMLALTSGQRTVPVLVRDGEVVQIGWQGRGCTVAAPSS